MFGSCVTYVSLKVRDVNVITFKQLREASESLKSKKGQV